MSGKCSVVAGNDCEAPANGPGTVRTMCFACGQPVCRPCSKVVSWPHLPWRRGKMLKRICRNCLDDHAYDDVRRARRMAEEAMRLVRERGSAAAKRDRLVAEERTLTARLYNVRAELRKAGVR